MDAETTIARLVELTKRAEQRIEFALKLKSGVLVARSPLFERGKKVSLEKRHIEIYKPRGRELTPGQIHADEAKLTDPHLAYAMRGPKQNYVKVIHAPPAADKSAAMANVADSIGIHKTFTGHLNHSGIVSRTHASAFGHSAIPTSGLMRHYRRAGYRVDVGEAKKIYRKAAANGRETARGFFRNWVPMIRQPKSPG